MKETPIIMSGNHPKLILDGIKTMTRRVIRKDIVTKNAIASIIRGGELGFTNCPYGQVGDRLWVRETLYRHIYLDEGGYLADETPVFINQTIGDVAKWQWQKDILPSIFMPRWASRITLEITEVRAERLQEITLVDIDDEILIPDELIALPDHKGKYLAIQQLFIDLWDSLNAKRGYGWEVNPWVWVISFRKLT